MTCVTTFVADETRVRAETVVEGPLDQLRKVPYIGPCLQFRKSEAFKRERRLEDFASRCLIWTMRGPVSVPDTARGKLTTVPPDHPNNNPPCTQWYVPWDRPHWGNIWGGVGASGDRPVLGLVGVKSRDGKWLAGFGAAHNLTLGQLYMDCIHTTPDPQKHLDANASRIVMRSVIYVIPCDPATLARMYLEDFPTETAFEVQPSVTGLRLTPKADAKAPIEVTLGFGAAPEMPAWKAEGWGGFVRQGKSWRMWACPHGNALELCVSWRADSVKPGEAGVVAALTGAGWEPLPAPAGAAVCATRSPDKVWTAALFWERSAEGSAGRGIGVAPPGETGYLCVRGRLVFLKGDPGDLSRLISLARKDWENSVPHRMPPD
jgi:hypothetical protein